MKYCYHTHTTRCGHATGTDEEYVLSAIQAGFKHLGFSDHAFLPNLSQPGIRGDYSEFDDYVNSINALKEKYKDQINIYIGFEAEHFPPFMHYYRYLLENKKIDYLVLGQHFDWLKINKVGESFFACRTKEDIFRYVEFVTVAMDSGLFKIFAHPDICFSGYEPQWDEHCIEATKMICESAIKNNVVLEINGCGIRRGYGFRNSDRYQYPYHEFWREVAKTKAKVMIGCDAHDPSHFQDDSINKALQFAQECGVTLLTDEEAGNLIIK